MTTTSLILALWLPTAAAEPDSTVEPTRESEPSSTTELAAEDAEPAMAETDGADPECDRLFGDAERQADNEARRERQLVMVREGPSYIDVVQTGGWDTPKEMAIRGIDLLETSSKKRTAVVRVDPGLGFCEPGEYEVEVDDAIGARGRILAVFDGVVLLEHDGALRYVRQNGLGNRPVFKVSWQSRFAVIAPTKSKGRSPSRKAKSRRRRRR